MSSPEVEKFEMTDNDYSQMFDPTSRGFRQSKNQATYGIWAESDDSGDERGGFGAPRRKKGQSSGSNLGSGISFVSGGIKEEASLEKGLKRGSADDQWMQKGKKGSSRESAPVPRYVKGHRQEVEKEFGGWERYTRGIGQKLLAKMGHRPGEGLGKTGQGITTPVEAVLRKGRGAVGLGLHGSERSQRSLQDFPVKDEEVEEEKEFQKQLSQWKRVPEKKQKPKYVYKTAQEVLETGGKRRKPVVATGPKVKVIDMTGREQRVLSGYHAIGKKHDRPDEEEDLIDDTSDQRNSNLDAFSMPELMHNLNLLVDMAEDDIVHNDRRLKHDRDRLVNLKYENDRLSDALDLEAKQLHRLNTVVELVESCEERLKPESREPLTLDSCAQIFKMLQDEYYEEYKIYDLSSLGIALIFPLMRTFFTGWLPLKDPTFGLATMLEWRVLLSGDDGAMATTATSGGRSGQAGMDVYERLIWDVWLPPVRAMILKWNVRDTDKLTTLLDTWQEALPVWVIGNILDQLVLPRLLQEVEEWNPLTDTTPIHCWLHPWLPLMGDKLEPLYAPIRHKIASALTNWHPSDSSAKIILEPWHGVFRPGHMAAFLVKNILPKLELEIRGMAINPHQQFLDPWRWVMSWQNMMPLEPLVSMLETTFFPKWHQVLAVWLSNMPNYQDITKWYLGWKSQFPETLLSHPAIKDQFNKALATMNAAVSMTPMPGMKENISYFTHAERRIMDSKAPPSTQAVDSSKRDSGSPGPVRSGVKIPSTFKDLVQQRAEQEDLLYIPFYGKTHEGKQIYRFGSQCIYYDHNVVFSQDKSGNWGPTPLTQLVDRAKSNS